MAIFGRTGSGKTNLLHTIIAQDIANGKGVCVIDPLGNLVRDILRYSIPANREQDVVVLDITNEPYPPPFNIVTPPADTSFDNAAQVMSILEKLWPDMPDSRWHDALFNAILTLWQEKKPIIRDVDRVLSDFDYRAKLLRKTSNPALLGFWADFNRKSPGDQDARIDPIKHRLRHFYRNNYLYPITCHPKPLNFTDLIQERKIILVSLPIRGGRLTEEERELLGALVIAQIQMAAMSGAAGRHGFYLFVDETQDFITTALSRMLSQARQFNLSLTLANQYLKQLVGDTPAFAVDNLLHWCQTELPQRFPGATHLFLEADGGGSNSARSRVWKQQLQAKLADGLGLTVTVCHYPPGTSKWNPIEHRLFSEISKTWAGCPLRSFNRLLDLIGQTTTTTGLTVQAHRVTTVYPTGLKVSDDEMAAINIQPHKVCPQWNYTIRPRPSQAG